MWAKLILWVTGWTDDYVESSKKKTKWIFVRQKMNEYVKTFWEMWGGSKLLTLLLLLFGHSAKSSIAQEERLATSP